MNYSGVILAGGKSSRMGFDKQQIKWKEKLLIEHQMDILRSHFSEIIIVSHNVELYEGNCILTSDELKDFGPMGGIHAALKAASNEYSYILACDMPNINLDYIDYMMNVLQSCEKPPQAVVTRFGEWIEPFNAFYSKSLIANIEMSYDEGVKRLSAMLETVDAAYIEEEVARKFSPDWSMFDNINTKEDLFKLFASLEWN